MFQQPKAEPAVSSSAPSAASPRRPIRTLGLSVQLPKKPKLDSVLASIERKDKSIDLPDLSPGSRNIPVLIEAFDKIPVGSDITLHVSQFATNPHDEPRTDLFKLWDAVKYKVKTIVWDQNKFFKSFVVGLSEEIRKDPYVARCIFQNCDKTSSCATDEPNPGFQFPKPEDLLAHTLFRIKEDADKDPTALKEFANFAAEAERYEI